MTPKFRVLTSQPEYFVFSELSAYWHAVKMVSDIKVRMKMCFIEHLLNVATICIHRRSLNFYGVHIMDVITVMTLVKVYQQMPIIVTMRQTTILKVKSSL